MNRPAGGRRHAVCAVVALCSLTCVGAALADDLAPVPHPAVGEVWSYRTIDMATGAQIGSWSIELQRVVGQRYAYKQTDLMRGVSTALQRSMNLQDCTDPSAPDATSCFGALQFPMKLGQLHGFEHKHGNAYDDEDCVVEAAEKVTVPAGSFDTIRIECAGRTTNVETRDARIEGHLSDTHWYAPAVNAEVRRIDRRFGLGGSASLFSRTELVSFKTAPPGASAAAAPASGVAVGVATGASGAAARTASPGSAATNAATTAAATTTAAAATAAAAIAASPAVTAPLVIPPGASPMAPDFMAGTTHFTGQFFRDTTTSQLTGTGRMAWENGDVYDGPIVGGQPNGEGSMAFATGDRYVGHFAAGLPDGDGKRSYASGDTYTGTFRHGQPDGQGTYVWKKGDRYVGGWKNGQRDGQGLMSWKNGFRWEGQFVQDQQGEGKMVRVP